MARMKTVVDPCAEEPVELKIKPKICEVCGGKYIPTSNHQKYCPVCRDNEKKKQALKKSKRKLDHEAVFGEGSYTEPPKEEKPPVESSGTGPVTTYRIEPRKKPEPPKPKADPDMEEKMDEWHEEYNELFGEQEEPERAALPDKLQEVDEIASVLRRYYQGDLIEKPEPEKHVTIATRLQQIADRICEEICRHNADYKENGEDDDEAFYALTNGHCVECPILDLMGGGVNDDQI